MRAEIVRHIDGFGDKTDQSETWATLIDALSSPDDELQNLLRQKRQVTLPILLLDYATKLHPLLGGVVTGQIQESGRLKAGSREVPYLGIFYLARGFVSSLHRHLEGSFPTDPEIIKAAFL